MKRDRKQMKRYMGLLLTPLLLLTAINLPSAHADSPIFLSNSAEDRKQPANMNYRYELIGMSVTVMKDDPGTIIFKANFSSSVSSTTFMSYGTSIPMLRIKVLNRLTDYKDQNGDIWLTAPYTTPYNGSNPIDAAVSAYRDPKVGVSSGRIDLTDCKSKTWMDSGATSNWVAFSIDRNCADINDIFWTTAFIDSDINASSYIYDSKWAPSDPMYVDMRSVPRPPKILNQTVTFSSVPGTQNLEFPNSVITATSSAGLQPNFASLTPTVCQVTPSGNSANIKAIAAGLCRIDAWADGNAQYKPSQHVQAQFTINPIVQKSQSMSWDQPYDVTDGDNDFDLNVVATSGLPVTYQSLTPSVCTFFDSTRPGRVTIMGPGTCEFIATQAGNEKYYSTSGRASFDVAEKPKADSSSSGSSSTTKPKPKPSPTTRTLGGTGSAAGGSSSVQTQSNSNAVAQQTTTKNSVKCKKKISGKYVVKTYEQKACPSGWIKTS